MSKNTFGKMMPRALKQYLELMGEQIMLARKRRHLSMQDIADRATVTRLTVSKVEHGDPTVSMGIYALSKTNGIAPILLADDPWSLQRYKKAAEAISSWMLFGGVLFIVKS